MEKWEGINEGGLSVVWDRIKQNFVSSIGFANNQITWSKGGVAQTPFTVGYATDSDTLDGYHASTWFKFGYAYPEGKSNKPYHLVAECEVDITSGVQTRIISFFVRRFYRNSGDTKHSGILVLRLRWNKNESAPMFSSATWSLNTGLPTENFILTYKNDEGIVTFRLYAKLTGYNSYSFTKIDETSVIALADEWVLHKATYSNEYAFASIPQDETQVVSENATITNPIAWSSVSDKPAAAGDVTTPVYWTGSGFTACTPYANASVNYANTAGSAPASDVYAWAKASTKPTYTLDEVTDGSTRKLANYVTLATNQTITGKKTIAADKLYQSLDNQLTYDSSSYVSAPQSYNAWHDHFAFLKVHTINSVQKSTDGTTWVDSDLDIRPLFIQKEKGEGVMILNASDLAFRFTLYSSDSFHTCKIEWFLFSGQWVSTGSATDILIECSADKNTWTTLHTSNSTFGSTSRFLKSATWPSNQKYIRFTFTKTSNLSTGSVKLGSIKGLTMRKGDQGQGIEYEVPYTWDATPNVTFPANVTASKFIGPLQGNVMGKVNDITLTAASTGFTIAGGTTSKTLTVNNTYTLGAACEKAFDTEVTQNSANLITSGAVWTAIDNLPEPMVFKGSLGTGGTITSLPTNGSASIGDTYKVITAGTYASKAAKVGDTFICLTKTSSANTWELIPSGDEPSGTVTSVGLSMPTGFSVSSSPITSSGTLAVSFASGYSLPTTAKQGNWDTAYTHATDSARLTTAKSSGFYMFATTAEGHIASVTAVEASDLTTLIGDTTYAPYNATGYQVRVSKLGSTTKPLYTSAAGTFAECSTYAGGTAVTLNGTSKAASTASFYAPTTAGVAGQILTSTAGTPEWKTGEIIHVLTDVSGTAAVTTSPYYASQWEGTADGVNALYTGLTITIKVPVAGNGSYGTLLNVNNLGAHPVLANVSTMVGTRYAVGCMVTLVYDADQTGSAYINSASASTITGCWKIADYNTDTNTLGYLIRTNSTTLPAKFKTYKYRLLFTSADGQYFVGANASTSTNATAQRTPTTEKIDPLGPIVYYGATTAIEANANFSTSYLWQQYSVPLGYSFNTTGSALTLTYPAPVYVKCTPQNNGSAIIDATTPYVQALPTMDDGSIYIYLGIAYDDTHIELNIHHPVYWFKDGKIAPYSPVSANALRLTATSKTAWGRTYWTANGVPDNISGNMDGVGIISINNQQAIRFKKYQSDDYFGVFVVSMDNNLYVGPYASGESCTTYIYGNPIIFRTKDSNNAGVLAATIDADKNFISEGDVKLNNNKGLYIKDSGSTYREVLKLDSNNILNFGFGTSVHGYDTAICGGRILLYASDGSRYQNIVTVHVDSGTNKMDVKGTLTISRSTVTASGMYLDSSNRLRIGDTGRATCIIGSSLTFYTGSTQRFQISSSGAIFTNNYGLMFTKYGGGTLDVFKIDTNDKVQIGNDTLSSEFYGTDFTFYVGSNAAATIDSNRNFTARGYAVGLAGVAAGGVADLAMSEGGGASGDYVTQVKVGNTAYSPTDGIVSLPEYPTASTLSGTIGIDKGGTGATTAEQARIALGISNLPSDTYTGATYTSGDGWCYDIWTPSSTTATFIVAYDPIYGGIGHVLICNTLSSDITVSFEGMESGQKIIAPANTLTVPTGKYVEVTYVVESVGNEGEMMIISWSNAMTKTTLQ